MCSHAVLFLWAPLPDSCGFITQLPSSTYFLPSSVPREPLPRSLLGTCQAWGDRIRELNTPGCASVTGGRKAANQHAFIFLQNNEELSLWLSVSLSAFLVSLFVPWSGSSQNRSPGVGKWDVWGCWKALGSPAVMEL